jgi:hypothetical protein
MAAKKIHVRKASVKYPAGSCISPASQLGAHLNGPRQPGSDAIDIASTIPADLADFVETIQGATVADAAKLIAGVKYLVKDWIPYAMLTGLLAEPGVGKSAFALWLVRSIVTGKPWFNDTLGPGRPGKVIWCATENDMAITLQRMKDWGIPFDKVILPFEEDPLRAVDLTQAADLERIEALVYKHRPLAVFIDSLRGGHNQDENDSRVGTILKALAGISERTHSAMPVVHHSRKLARAAEITANDARGSNSILANFRSMIGFDRPDPKRPTTIRIRLLKENLGIKPTPLGFDVTPAGLEFGPAPEKPSRVTQEQKAVDWLRQQMTPGKWHHCDTLLDGAEQAGLSRSSVFRARQLLGISDDNVRKNGKGWEWLMPQAPTTPDGQQPPASQDFKAGPPQND